MARSDSLRWISEGVHAMSEAHDHASFYAFNSDDVGDFGSDRGDHATHGVALNAVMQSRESQAEHSLAVANTVERIKDGTFGLCVACLAAGKTNRQSEISIARLKAVPLTPFCIEHQQASDQGML